MDRLRSDKGFTLIEVLLMLFLISTLMLSVSVRLPKAGLSLGFQMRMAKEQVLAGQASAMKHKERVAVIFTSDALHVGEKRFSFFDGMRCTPISFHFTEKGTISKAGSVSCSLHGHKRKVVFQLGSGQSDIR